MIRSVLALSSPTVPLDVVRFAAQKGVSRYLPAVADLAQQAFATSVLAVSVGQDAEDETHQYIAIDVNVSGLQSEELLASQRTWSVGLAQVCPSRLAVYFVLGWR